MLIQAHRDWQRRLEEEANAVTHLCGGLIGEGHRKDRLRRNALPNHLGDPVGDDSCLASAGAGQDQHRSFGCKRGFALLRVEIV